MLSYRNAAQTATNLSFSTTKILQNVPVFTLGRSEKHTVDKDLPQ